MRLGATSLNVTSRSRGGSVSTSPSYIISCSDTVDEGSSLNVTINTTNVPAGNVIYWSTSNVTTSDSDISIRSGNVAVNTNGAATFSIPIVADQVTENVPETFDLIIKTGSQLGTEVNRKRITVNDTSLSPPPTYSLSTNSIVTEGTTFTSTVTTNYVADGTTLYWNINHGTTSSADFADTQGTFTVSTTSGTNASGTFDISVLADELTEGTTNETFTIQVREDSHTGTLVLNSSVSINDTSQTPVYTVNAHGGATSVDEGTALQFDVTTTNVATGTTLYWGVSSNAGDFTTSTGQVVTDSNGNASFSVTPDADLSTEGPESFAVSIYTDSARQNSVDTSSSITINDTSITATYSMSTSAPSIDEGSALTLTVTTAGVPNNTDLYWRITSGAGDFTTTQGTVTITGTYASGSGTFTVTPDADATTEGTETFDVTLYTNSARTIYAADVSGIQIGDTSQEPTYSMALPTGFNGADEGSATTITVNVDTTVNTTLYWSITSGAGEFSTTQGSVTINGQSATFDVTPTADQLTENTAEYFDITLYDDSARTSQIATLTNIEINDTSQTPPATYTMSVPQGTAAPEGSATTVTVNASGLVNNAGTAYWKITTLASEFQITQGTVNISNSSGTFDVTPTADSTTEGTEIFTITLYSDSGFFNNVATLSIPINDTSLDPPTYTLSSTNTSVNEGSTLTIDVTTTTFNGATNSGTLYWGITTNAADFTINQGSVTITNGSGAFDVTPDEDATTEGSENFVVEIYTDAARTNSVDTLTRAIGDTSLDPTYSLAAQGGATSVNEGSSIGFNITTTDVSAGTVLYWEVVGSGTYPASTADFTSSNGSVTISSSGQASFTVAVVADRTSEYPETFDAKLFTDSARNNEVDSVTGIQIGDTSQDPTYTISTANNAVNEGSSITFNVVTTDVLNNTTLYWTVAGVGTNNPAAAADFTSTSGSFTVSTTTGTNGSGSFQVSIVADTTTEGPQEFGVTLWEEATHQTQLATYGNAASPVIINDTSQSPPTWTLTSNSGSMSVDEGSGFVVDVAATSITGTPTYHWLVRAGLGVNQGADFASGGYTGSFTMTNTNGSGTGQFTVTPLADNITEGDETMYIDLYTDSSYGTKLGDIGPITVNDTSKALSATMTPAGGTTVDEGATMTVNVATTGIANGATLYWEIFSNSNYNPTVSPSADFTASTGSFTVSATGNWGDGSGSFQITCVADQVTEGDEQFDIRLYSDSARTVNVSNLYGLTVADTSTAPPTVWNFWYHGFGADIMPLRLYYVRTNGTAFLLDTFGSNGQTHAQQHDPWTNVTYSLGAYTGIPGYIALVAQQGTPTADLGDWAITGNITYANGTVDSYSGVNSTNRGKWRHAWGYSSPTSAAAATPTTSLARNGSHRWVYDSGGTTNTGYLNPTGPSAASSGSTTADYIHWEPSSSTSSYIHIRSSEILQQHYTLNNYVHSNSSNPFFIYSNRQSQTSGCRFA